MPRPRAHLATYPDVRLPPYPWVCQQPGERRVWLPVSDRRTLGLWADQLSRNWTGAATLHMKNGNLDRYIVHQRSARTLIAAEAAGEDGVRVWLREELDRLL